MYKIRTFNQISVTGLERFPRQHYEIASEIGAPDAILLRSHVLAPADIAPSVKAVGRAGAGVNNIPVSSCTEQGIVVFNTPGANANAVKELVACAMLLCSRGIVNGINYVRSQAGITDSKALHAVMEAEKKHFKGTEILGKTLGVVGLGAIGSKVARLGHGLGMEVIGYDPALSVEAAWRLPSEVRRMENLGALFQRADFVTLHLPVLDSTRNLVNAESLAPVRRGASLLNFAREEIVDVDGVLQALESGGLAHYITDFPHPRLIGRKGVVAMPHIGASTAEAEENCAVMAADQLRGFLEHGNIRNSVNFPALELDRSAEFRLAITNRNRPGMLGNILSILADGGCNVSDMVNRSRDEIAYNLIDLNQAPSDDVLTRIRGVDGVINVRLIPASTC